MSSMAGRAPSGGEGGGSARLTWIGHATVLVDLDGVRVLTDPLLRPRVAHLRRRGRVDAASLRSIDAVLISHVHYDHLDLPSLERLGRSTPIVVPRGAGALLRRRRFEHVVEAGVGDELRIGSLAVTATRADHEATRGPLLTKAPSLGFVVEGSRSVYFAGDTDLFDEMAAIGPVDVALVPIWGWGPSIGPGHLDPRQAAAAVALLRARVAVPVHWGTYYPLHVGPAPFLVEPAETFRQAAAELAPEAQVRVLAVGDTLELEPVGAAR
jgi:L-ascorbate metabolism protein UlaG (beta-lactamase superfamily)